MSARCADEVWKVIRMHPSGLIESLSREVIASQSVHSTHCFIQSHQKLAWLATSCPLTDGSPTEFSTIYTVLKDAQAISITMGQEDTLSNSIWSCYLCEGQANTVEACKKVFLCCDSNGGNCEEQLSSTDSRPTVCWQLADTKPTGHRQVANRLATGGEITLQVHFCTQKSM